MTTHSLIAQAYAAFNRRDADATLALMCEDVSWPRASEGGRVIGKQAIRDYWARQWADFDPRLAVLAVIDREDGKTEARVHQIVQNHHGDVLSDTTLSHVYTIHDNLIQRMDIVESGGGNAAGPSSAFTGHTR